MTNLSDLLLNINCICTSVSFISVLMHLIGIAILLILLRKIGKEAFFIFLLIGLSISLISESLDFWHNLLVSLEQQYVYYNPKLDAAVEILQIIGFGLIFGIMFKYWRETYE